MRLTIRTATVADLDAINAIYNDYVARSTCTYQESPESPRGRREWFARHDESHPVVVAEVDRAVVGWGALSPYHERSAYRHTVEDSVYAARSHHRRGVGSAWLAELIRRATTIGHRSIVAAIDGEQVASIALHARFGFREAGCLRQVGRKFGRWLDVLYMQLILGSDGTGGQPSGQDRQS
jgi:phosphinothricin acetyltransferase